MDYNIQITTINNGIWLNILGLEIFLIPTAERSFPGAHTDHMNAHTGIKTYSYVVCRLTITTCSNYNSHLRTHITKMPVNLEVLLKRNLSVYYSLQTNLINKGIWLNISGLEIILAWTAKRKFHEAITFFIIQKFKKRLNLIHVPFVEKLQLHAPITILI